MNIPLIINTAASTGATRGNTKLKKKLNKIINKPRINSQLLILTSFISVMAFGTFQFYIPVLEL